MRITVAFEFDDIEPDRELDVRRIVSSQLTPICEAVQPTGWRWQMNDYEEADAVIRLDLIMIGAEP